MAQDPLSSDIYYAALPSIHARPLQRMPKSLYRYIWRVSGPQQVRLTLLTLLIFPLTLLPLELQRRIVDQAIANEKLTLLLELGALYLGVIVTRALLKFLRNTYMDRVTEGVTRALRRRIATHPPADMDSDEGTRQSILSSEAEKVGGFVAEGVAEPLLHLGTVLSVAGYMLVVEPLLAAVALGFLLPAMAVVGLAQPALNRLSEKKIATTRKLGQQLLGQQHEAKEENRGQKLIEHIYRLRLRFTRIKHGAKQLNNLINHLGPLSVLMMGGYMVIQGQTELGTIVAFISGYERMTDPARSLLNFYRNLSLMRIQYQLVHDASHRDG